MKQIICQIQCWSLLGVILLISPKPATAQWSTILVDALGADGVSLAVVKGNPAISYYQGADLKYVRATDPAGAAWGAPITVAPAFVYLGADLSLVVVNGHPAIAYFDQDVHKLYYVRANDDQGTTWGLPVTLASSQEFSWDWNPSMTLINGRPAIAFFRSTGADLGYVRAADGDGATWNASITLDSTGLVGLCPSLAAAGGNPVISYFDLTNLNLKFIRSSDASGIAWGAPIVLDSAGTVGYYDSLAIINGNPAISYHDESNNRLKYVRATNVTGTSWGTRLNVNPANSGAHHTSLAVIGGNPAISYFEGTTANLRFVQASDADGVTWGVPELVAVASAVQPYGLVSNSLTTVYGVAAVAFAGDSASGMRFAIRLSPAPTPLPNMTLSWTVFE